VAFYIAFISRQNYLLPLYVDEWNHIAFIEEIVESGRMIEINSFSGEPLQLVDKMEFGFQLRQ
jgi:hypothetical protein